MCRSVFSVDNIQIDPFRAFWVNCDIIPNIIRDKKNAEKTRQIYVNFSDQSRKEICKESLLSSFLTLTFSRQFCHLWLLRMSLVAFDLVICGI